MAFENLTWVIIGLSAVSFIAYRHKKVKSVVFVVPDNQTNDPTRWPLNLQSPGEYVGNRGYIRDHQAEKLLRTYFS